jgi:hypothetical protein
MANSDIISAILEHCRRHEAGEITATQLESEIEAHAQALEGLSTAEIFLFRDFNVRLIDAYFDDTTPTVMAEYRSWLRLVSPENVAEPSSGPSDLNKE